MDLDKKIKKIEESCLELAERDATILAEEIQNISSQKIDKKLEAYKEQLAMKYAKEMNKMSREYNKELFDYEMNQKVKVNQFKENLVSNIKTKLETELTKFVNSDEYKVYLWNHIRNTMKNACVENTRCKLLIVERDFYKYQEEIMRDFNVDLERIDNNNIGGCMVINLVEKIAIDNTIKTNMQEQIKAVKF